MSYLGISAGSSCVLVACWDFDRGRTYVIDERDDDLERRVLLFDLYNLSSNDSVGFDDADDDDANCSRMRSTVVRPPDDGSLGRLVSSKTMPTRSMHSERFLIVTPASDCLLLR